MLFVQTPREAIIASAEQVITVLALHAYRESVSIKVVLEIKLVLHQNPPHVIVEKAGINLKSIVTISTNVAVDLISVRKNLNALTLKEITNVKAFVKKDSQELVTERVSISMSAF